MKDNKFERLYGFVFRSLAKSILQDFVKKNDEEYLTIGILQYNPYDESFSYAPTLKNCLLLPDEIDGMNFPSEKNYLWNHELMAYLATYLGQSKADSWINQLFDENLTISKENDSTYSITYDGYDLFIASWKTWYNDNKNKFQIDALLKIENVDSKKLLNQVFFFGNFLLTITRHLAFGSPVDRRTYAEGMYLCISNPQLLGDNGIFNKKTGFMIKGENILWTHQPQTLIHKAELNRVLEICFRWPFNTNDKIKELKHFINRNIDPSLSRKHYRYLNATAVPLNYHGEFLGICYLSQPTISDPQKNIAHNARKLKNKVDASKITGILYQSRFTTARLALQQIDENSFKEKTISRIFNLSHLYSSVPIIALIDNNNNLTIRSRDEKELINKMQTKALNKKGSELIKFLEDYIPEIKAQEINKQSFGWYDIFDKHIIRNNRDEILAYNCINRFNEDFFNYLKESNPTLPQQYKISSLIYLKVEVDDILYSLLFFNSNFIQLYKTKTSLTAKQSYALSMHNNIKQLIEAEQTSRLVFYQNKQFQEDIRKGVIHYIKGFLNRRILPFLKISITDEDREQLISNSNKLASRLKDWLEVFDIESKVYPITIEELENIWLDITKEYPVDINFIFEVEEELLKNKVKIFSNPQGLRIIFSEIINNALDEYEAIEIFDGTITLSLSEENKSIKLSLRNSDTWISTKYIDIAGLQTILGDKDLSSGIGFLRCEGILAKIGASVINDRHFTIYNIDEPKGFCFSFYLKGE